MPTLRFPNAVSDIGKFMSTFNAIYQSLSGKPNFTHDDARDVLIKHGLVSSSGAIGNEAVSRSERDNRSLDPLYNQLKMYSEVYRMLGWYKPGTMRTNFDFTELSDYVGEKDETLRRRLFEECLLGITFPNELVENRSETTIRPFAFLLKLMLALGGEIHREELILGVLNLQDDTIDGALTQQVSYINSIRGDYKKLTRAIDLLASNDRVQVNTLQNYTRFPLGSLKFTGWAEDVRNRTLYDRPVVSYELTEYGIEKANQVNRLIDIRHGSIQKYSLDVRASFTLLSHYAMLERIGFPIDEVIELLNEMEFASKIIFDDFKIEHRNQILYSPVQQGTQEELNMANNIAGKFS
jgi:hypothetical protein